MKLGLWLVAAGAALALVGCGDSGSAPKTDSGSPSTTASTDKPAGNLPFVAFVQANSKDPWRQQFDAETKAEAGKHASDFTFEEQSGQNDDAKQISIIDTFMVRSPKVLLISPNTTAVEAKVTEVFKKDVPVVVLDRDLPGGNYTVYVGGDNLDMGRQAGDFLAKQLNGKGTVLMIQGKKGVQATDDRREGALAELKKYPGIVVTLGDDCDFAREKAQNYMQTVLQTGKHYDAIYAHNDEMAIGAYQAYDHFPTKPAKKPIFVGMDGCQQEVIKMIQDGKLDATLRYPDPGPTGIQIASDLLKGKKPEKKKVIVPTVLVTKANADQYLKDNPNLVP